MNTTQTRIYERLRKQSRRAMWHYIDDTRIGDLIDWRQWGLIPTNTWDDTLHTAFVAGVRAALKASEADTNDAYERGWQDGANYINSLDELTRQEYDAGITG